MEKPYTRPVYLNLLAIRLPPQAVASLAHRISGFVLFLSLPVLLFLLELSLTAEGYGRIAAAVESRWLLLLLLPLIWSGFHHLFAGIRYLLIDVDVGVELATARLSARLVSWGALGATALTGVLLW